MRLPTTCFAIASISAFTYAIPTLTNANMAVVGDTSTTVTVDTTQISSVGDAGAGVTWDFSGFAPAAGTYPTKRYALKPSETPYAALYPNATHCERTVQAESQVDNYQYYIVTAEGASVVGASGGVIDSTRYSNADQVMPLPFTYGDSVSDSASLTQYIHGTQIRTEQMRTTVGDGYGTLKLPSGTYDNVLRYKVTVDQTVKFMSGNSVLSTTTIHTIEYFWADAGYQEYLLEYTPVFLYNGAQKKRSGNYWTDPKLVGASGPTTIRLTASGNHLHADRSAFLRSDGWSFSLDGIPSLPRSPLGRLLPVSKLHP